MAWAPQLFGEGLATQFHVGFLHVSGKPEVAWHIAGNVRDFFKLCGYFRHSGFYFGWGFSGSEERFYGTLEFDEITLLINNHLGPTDRSMAWTNNLGA